jgi:hypothetical protein
MTTTLNTPSTTNPCPDWCTQPQGHGYDCVMRDLPCREHIWDQDDPTGATVCGWGFQTGDGETVEMDGVTVWIRGNAGGPEITAAEARDLAASLLVAADKLDAITADGAA